VTDVPAEEGSDIRSVFSDAGLDTVFLVSPTSPASRMTRAARLSSGFLYVISRRGTTGVRGSLPADLPATVARARRAAGRLPVVVGFGISTAGMARAAALLADGVVVGSALVARAEESGSTDAVEKFARGLARACRRSSRRARVGNRG
jgi:tryptophan synthase alpha chain